MIAPQAFWLACIGAFATGCRQAGTGPLVSPAIRPDACAAIGSAAPALLSYVRQLVAAVDTLPRGDNATRVSYGLPRLDPAAVTLATDPTTCTKAAEAYTRVTNELSDVPAVQRRMHVVRAGNRFVVEDAATPARFGEFSIWAVFTSDWRLVTKVLS